MKLWINKDFAAYGGGRTRNITRLQPQTQKFAFTLAEILITLGIIGVVAAMTIPALLTAHQKKVTVTKLQKAISVLNQAYRLSYDENGEVTAEEAHSMGTRAYFDKYWAPYIKTAHVCNTYSDCGYSKNAPWKYLNNTEWGLAVTHSEFKTTFITADGVVYLIITAMGSGTDPRGYTESNRIYVDINGGKGPNIMGKDLFALYRYVDEAKGGAVLTNGSSTDKYHINLNCSPTGTGAFCAEKIRRAGWQIDKSYPW